MAVRAVGIAALILVVFALFGEDLLRVLGISLDSFRIAGGIMLFLIALDMVFEKRTERREQRAQKVMETPEIEDVSIFPMAIPMLAGPGAIAAIMLLMNEASDLAQTFSGDLNTISYEPALDFGINIEAHRQRHTGG